MSHRSDHPHRRQGARLAVYVAFSIFAGCIGDGSQPSAPVVTKPVVSAVRRPVAAGYFHVARIHALGLGLERLRPARSGKQPPAEQAAAGAVIQTGGGAWRDTRYARGPTPRDRSKAMASRVAVRKPQRAAIVFVPSSVVARRVRACSTRSFSTSLAGVMSSSSRQRRCRERTDIPARL